MTKTKWVNDGITSSGELNGQAEKCCWPHCHKQCCIWCLFIMTMIMFWDYWELVSVFGENASRYTKRRFVYNCHFWILLTSICTL